MSAQKQKNTESALELIDYTDAEKVMSGKSATSAKDLLKITYANGEYPYSEKMKLADYEREKYLLQIELLKVQRWAKEQGKKIVIIFEGRDAAGKGGTIKTFYGASKPSCCESDCIGKTK